MSLIKEPTGRRKSADPEELLTDVLKLLLPRVERGEGFCAIIR